MNWNIYSSKISTERAYQYSDYFIDPTFQGVNILFIYHLKMKNKEPVTNDIIFGLYK